MFNTLFSALENTRSSISKAFNKLKSGSMSQERLKILKKNCCWLILVMILLKA